MESKKKMDKQLKLEIEKLEIGKCKDCGETERINRDGYCYSCYVSYHS